MIGAGLGSFLGGVQQGIGAFTSIQDAVGKQRVRTAQRDAAAATTAARDSEVSAALASGQQAPAAEGASPSWNIGGQTYGSEADARGAAERQVGSFYDRYMRDHAPRVMQTMLENGQGDQAEAFQKRLGDAQFQRGIRSFGGFMRATTMGDHEGARRSLVEMYNNPGYIADGNQVTASRLLRDQQNNITGMSFTVRGANGEEREQTFNGMGDVQRLGMAFLSPEKAIEWGQKEQQQRDRTSTQLALAGISQGGQNQRQATSLANSNEQLRFREQGANARHSDTQNRTDNRHQRGLDAAGERQRAGADAALDRTVVGAQVRASIPPRAAAPREVRPEDRQRSIEVIRGNMSRTDFAFGQLPQEEQIKRAAAAYERQLEIARGVNPSGGGTAPPAPSGGSPRPTVLR